jgi:hypothetical protein
MQSYNALKMKKAVNLEHNMAYILKEYYNKFIELLKIESVE